METHYTHYLCTCTDDYCTGRCVMEFDPPIPTSPAPYPGVFACPPCPLCGRNMKSVPLTQESTEFIPEPPGHGEFGITLRSRTVFQPSAATFTADEEHEKGQERPAQPNEREEVQASSADTLNPEQGEKSGKELLTEEDVAGILDVSVTAVRRLVREKKLGFVQLTQRKKAFPRELIDEFIARESGLSARQGRGITGPLLPKPNHGGIPIEESRKLLRKVLKKS